MATNVSNLPATAFSNTFVQRITKMAVQRALTDPFILGLLKNDASFNRDLDKSFDQGDVANVIIAPKLTAEIINDVEADPSYQSGTFEKVTVTLDNIARIAWTYRDVNEAIADINIADALAKSGAISLVEKIVTHIINKMINHKFKDSTMTLGTAGTDLNEALFRKIRSRFQVDFNVPQSETLNMVVHPYDYEDLLAITRFTQMDSIGSGDSIRTGLLDNVYNIRVYSDRNVPANSGSDSFSGSTGYLGMVFRSEAAVLTTRQLPLTSTTFQSRVNLQGIAALTTMDLDGTTGVGMEKKIKTEVLFGFESLPTEHNSSGDLIAPIYPIIGGI